MLQAGSKVKVLDNSGYGVVKVINVYGKRKLRIASIGDLVQVTSTRYKNAGLDKGRILKALVVNVRKPWLRKKDSTYLRFPENGVIIVNPEKAQFDSLGTRINGAVPLEILKKLNKKSRSKVKHIV